MAAQWKLGAAMWKTNERTSYFLCDILLSIVDNLSSKVGKICVLNPPWFDIKAIKTIKIILKLVKIFFNVSAAGKVLAVCQFRTQQRHRSYTLGCFHYSITYIFSELPGTRK